MQHQRNPLLGTLAALSVVFVWSIWLVISRAGALTSLTAYDLAALRYGVSALFTLPLVVYFKPWRGMSLVRIIVLTTLLGPLYVLMAFGGFKFAPAAHGGIFMNGALPLMTLAISWLWLAQRARARHIAASLIILLGVFLTIGDTNFHFSQTWKGDALFVGAAVFFRFYVIVSRLWDVRILQVLLCSSLLNAFIYVPVWYFFLPSGMAKTPIEQLWPQILFQGLVPNLFGLLMVSIAARHIGANGTSAFMAAVPGLVAVLSQTFLGETLGWPSWLGLTVLTGGILMMAGRSRTP
mgnify:CR=1 FL=1